jgi:hypothetical protein
MAIDIRATVTCSLGTLISGSISDDYLQGSGLVKTRGSCEISGLITPAMGDVVTFSYTKGGVTRNIPRKLRVLSSFADPFRRTTKVELGCKLTYLSDLQEPVKWTAFDDNANNDFSEDDQRIITLPIRAASAMAKCLTELGITASSSPLTNKFSIAEFDFSAGYVQVLSDLLVSESFFGYLDTNEVLQVRSLNQDGGTGPVLTSADIVDVGPIGVGQLPGEAVTVSYSSLKLKPPELTTSSDEEDEETQEQIQRINWELDQAVGTNQDYFINYKTTSSDTQRVKVYSGASWATTFTRYGEIIVFNPETGRNEPREVVTARITKNFGPSISIAAPFAQAYLENGFEFNNVYIQLSGTNTFYEYSNNGSKIVTTEETYKTKAEQAGSLGIDLVYSYTIGIPPITVVEPIVSNFGFILTEVVITESETIGDASKEVASRYKLLSDTQHGQQAIASIREDIVFPEEAQKVIVDALSGLVFDSANVQSRTSGTSDALLPTRPSSAERINQVYAKGGSPSNGWRTESKAQLELALGSATAQRRIEFSMPYAPDDVFTKLQTGGGFNAVFTFYSSIASDAPAKANRYGRVQNRLLLGNRSGVNLQVAPERMPAAPFDPIFVQAAGLTALYRVNGNQWAFDSNGIVCSTDALYWGVAGKNS